MMCVSVSVCECLSVSPLPPPLSMIKLFDVHKRINCLTVLTVPLSLFLSLSLVPWFSLFTLCSRVNWTLVPSSQGAITKYRWSKETVAPLKVTQVEEWGEWSSSLFFLFLFTCNWMKKALLTDTGHNTNTLSTLKLVCLYECQWVCVSLSPCLCVS